MPIPVAVLWRVEVNHENTANHRDVRLTMKTYRDAGQLPLREVSVQTDTGCSDIMLNVFPANAAA
jgi:hypothetical protein